MEFDLGKLTKRQQKILDFIKWFTDEHGYPPTVREIGSDVKISSTSVVSYNLKQLVKRKYLYREEKVSRGTRLSDEYIDYLERQNGTRRKRLRAAYEEYRIRFAPDDGLLKVPELGVITAGVALEVPAGDITYTDEEDYIDVPESMVGEADDMFALRVDGYSMVDAMVNDGDIVVLQRQQTARNGEMVAVLLKDRGETTLKRFYQEGPMVRLQPANPYMDSILVEAENIEIQGRVLAVLRTLI